MFNAVFYHLQLLNLMIDGRKLFAQRSDRIFNPKTFHLCFNLIEGKADSFHDANRIQIVKLAGTVIAVTVIRISICRTEKSDFIVENQSLARNVLQFGKFTDGK